MRSPIWFYLFWGLVFILVGICILPQLTSQNDGKINIKNVFFDLEKSMQNKNDEITESINQIHNNSISAINKDPLLKVPIGNGINDVRKKVNEFCNKIDSYKIALTAAALIQDKSVISDKKRFNLIVSNSTIDVINFEGRKISRKNDDGKIFISKEKDWTTYLMVELEYGEALKSLVENTRKELIEIYSNMLLETQEGTNLTEVEILKRIEKLVKQITLYVDKSWKKSSDKNSWSAANFDHMPYAACMPILEKFKSDARNAEVLIINDLAELITEVTKLKYDKIIPLIQSTSYQLKKGEIFEAKIILGMISSEVGETSSISVNGMRVSLNKNGEGFYKETTNKIGNRALNIEANYQNPLTGEIMKTSTTYEYIVTE